MTVAQAKRFLGAIRDPARVAAVKARNGPYTGTVLSAEALPTDFDVRTAFPWAINVTSVIRDQSACGSCEWRMGPCGGCG